MSVPRSLARGAVVLALALLGVSACGGSGSSAGSSSSSSTTSSSRSSTTDSASQGSSTSAPPSTVAGTVDALDITLSGGHTGTLSQFDTPLDCNADFRENVKVYHVTFHTKTDGLKFEVLINESGPGTFQISDENVSVDGPDDARLHWSSLNGSSGTVTIHDDLSGSIEGEIASRDGSLPGDGSKLGVKGTWSCASYELLAD